MTSPAAATEPVVIVIPAPHACLMCHHADPTYVDAVTGMDEDYRGWRIDRAQGCPQHRLYRFTVGDATRMVQVQMSSGAYLFDSLVEDFIEKVANTAARKQNHYGPSACDLSAVLAAADLAARAGVSPEQALLWGLAGWEDPATVRTAIRIGVRPQVASEWMADLAHVPCNGTAPGANLPHLLIQWWIAEPKDITPAEITRWWEAGVLLPTDRPDGLSAADARTLSMAEVTDRDPAWAGIGKACPDLVRHGLYRGHSPAEMVALFATLRDAAVLDTYPDCEHPGDLFCGWTRAEVANAVVVTERSYGLNWADVAVCLRAGMPSQAAAEYVRSGAEIEPVRLLAALTG